MDYQDWHQYLSRIPESVKPTEEAPLMKRLITLSFKFPLIIIALWPASSMTISRDRNKWKAPSISVGNNSAFTQRIFNSLQ